MLTRLATSADIVSILALQADNLITNIPLDQQSSGFVTTPFTPAQIQDLIAQTGAFVADVDGEIQGYLFAGTWTYFSQWAIFPYMVSRFPNLSFQGQAITAENSFQYGPICVARSHRGSPLFPQMFKTMCHHFAHRFPIGITFINKRNGRSLAAHQKLDLTIIDEFEFIDNQFCLLAFPTAIAD